MAATAKKRFITNLAKVTSSCEDEKMRLGFSVTSVAELSIEAGCTSDHKGFYPISSGGRVVQDLVEKLEDGQLEQQGVHLEAESQTVEHPGDAVVGVGRVLGVGFQ